MGDVGALAAVVQELQQQVGALTATVQQLDPRQSQQQLETLAQQVQGLTNVMQAGVAAQQFAMGTTPAANGLPPGPQRQRHCSGV